MAGAGLAAYAAWEARQYTLRRVTVPILPAGQRPLRVLHLSDVHMTPGQTRKQEWLRGLADLQPDLVVNTGDNLAHRDSVPSSATASGRCSTSPGSSSSGPTTTTPPRCATRCATCSPTTGSATSTRPQLPWRDLGRAFTDAGWIDLTNTRDALKVGEHQRSRSPASTTRTWSTTASPTSRARPTPGPTCASASRTRRTCGCSTSSPSDGYDAIIAGHTHGGQVCLPGRGALTTNCDLEPARAKGLHRHPADSRPGDPGSSWLHVSAGLGTSPYARIRVACRPEATLLTLAPTG